MLTYKDGEMPGVGKPKAEKPARKLKSLRYWYTVTKSWGTIKDRFTAGTVLMEPRFHGVVWTCPIVSPDYGNVIGGFASVFIPTKNRDANMVKKHNEAIANGE